MKELVTKVEILKEEFETFYNYELIDHINTRIKKPESIIKKMEDKNYEKTYRNLVEQINDIAGLRVICPIKDNVFTIVDLIKNMPDVNVIKEKDYITKPKKSGYSSYHMIVEVPVPLMKQIIPVKVEIQIRTLAMDFWASLEHDLRYKSTKNIPEDISREMFNCADEIAAIDVRMQRIYKQIQKL